jgi:hypothetical protein
MASFPAIIVTDAPTSFALPVTSWLVDALSGLIARNVSRARRLFRKAKQVSENRKDRAGDANR